MARGGTTYILIGTFVSILAGVAQADDRIVMTPRRDVRLADIMDLSPIPVALRARAAEVVVGTVPDGQRSLMISAARLNARARAALPALASYLPVAKGAVNITYTGLDIPRPVSPPVTSVSTQQCVRVVRDIGRGVVLTPSDFVAAACGTTTLTQAYTFARNDGNAVSSRAIVQGELLRAMPPFALASVRPGASLTVSTRIGPVTVQRSVSALQAGRPGRQVFVQAADGEVFTALVPLSAP